MSDYPTKLPVPHALLSYNATIATIAKAGDKSKRMTGPVEQYITVPEGLPCKPLVLVQAFDLAGRENGPCWKWDYDADQGRGIWVVYDERIHEVPQVNAVLPDAEPVRPALDLSAKSAVELDQSADAPESDDPPVESDDDECDEPSCVDDAESDEFALDEDEDDLFAGKNG